MAVVEIDNLKKRYGSNEALAGVSFSVDNGEIFGLLGPNGAGKTTCIECLEGLRDPSEGTISVLGLDPAIDGRKLRRRIGMQLQESALPNDIKVWEALDLYASFYDNPVDWELLLQRFGIAEKRDSRFSSLSGGQKQRLYIALALINDPEIVFFDEITTGLDPQSRRVMWDLMKDIRDQGKTIFLTTHFMDEAETLCDRLVIIDGGKIIAEGTTPKLAQQLELKNRVNFTTEKEIDITRINALPDVADTVLNNGIYTVYGTGDLLIKTVLDYLVAAEIKFLSINSEFPNLEDVFLTLTGRSVRE
jgi:ABC-2 type transport system ATP-binding protein